ncbi:MAG: type II toxin-antitoxin system VapC family toxin [Coriobacteriia bacterium]|nr:type II toxin-antitoxin system VapC family toxin [Coriobacteriia bacterium]
MNAHVIDASVTAKCVLPEQGSDHAANLVAAVPLLLAPEIMVSEGANAVWKARHRRSISDADALDALGTLLAMPVLTLPLEPLTPLAFDLALKHDHPIYDCYYLAAAIANDCPLATADKRLHELALRAGLGERAILIT